MKLFICSDIHGDKAALTQTLSAFEASQADYLVLLGDLLNHGPRNALPDAYDPLAVAELLNPFAERIIAVRGNCDSEVDQALCQFPMLSEYNQLVIGNRRVFCCHGHTYSPAQLPTLAPGDLFVSGHTHIPIAENRDGFYIMNPGSVAIPRQDWPASFGLVDEHGMKICQLDNQQPILECAF